MARGRGEVELILVSPIWPGETRGYAIAVRASLRQYVKVFSRVHFLGLVEQPFQDMASWKPWPVEWIHHPVVARPKWFRFLKSLFIRLPAATVRYAAAAASVRESVLRIRDEARLRGRSVALVFEDVPLAYFLPALRREFPEMRIAVRSHNVLVKAFDGCDREGSLLERLCWSIELAKVRRFEQSICCLADRLWPISAHDSQEYVQRLSVRSHGVVGVSLNTTRYADVGSGDPLTVIHIGSADLRKGRGLAEFVRRAWPAIRQQVPEAQLVLAGRGTERFADAAQGIQGLGFVSDDVSVLEKGRVFVNPQQIGSGVKLKSIVAMLAGKALVTTPTGIEGVEGTDGEDFLVSRDFEAMAEHVGSLLKDEHLAMRLGQSARAVAAAEYDEDALARAAVPLLEDFAGLVSASGAST